jgi:WD40 repeat protein
VYNIVENMLGNITTPYQTLEEIIHPEPQNGFEAILNSLDRHIKPRQQQVYESADASAIAVSRHYIWIGKSSGIISGVSVEGFREEKEMRGHLGAVRVMVMMSDDVRLISGDADGAIIIWNINQTQIMKVIKYNLEITGIIKHVSQSIIAYSIGNYTVFVWDLNKEELIKEYYGHNAEVVGLGFIYQDSREMLITADEDGHGKIWDIHSQDPNPVALVEFDTQLNSMVSSYDGKTVIAGGENCMLYIWQVKDPENCIKLKGHTQPITKLLITSDDEICISLSEDNLIKAWNLKEMSFLCDIKNFKKDVNSLCLSPGDIYLYTLNEIFHSQAVSKFQLAENLSLENVLNSEMRINNYCVMESGDIIYCIRNKVYRYNTLERKAENIKTFEVNISHMILSRSRKQLILADNTNIKIFEIVNNKLEKPKPLSEHSQEVEILVCSDDSRYLVSASKDNLIYLWDLTSQQDIKKIALTQSHHENSVPSANSIIKTFSLKSLSSYIKSLPDISCIAISKDSSFIIVGLTDGNLNIFPTDPSLSNFTRIPAHTKRIVSLYITPNNSTIITIGLDNTMKLWDMLDQVMIAEFKLQTISEPRCSIMTEDGEYICIGAGNDISLWSITDQLYLGSLKMDRSVSKIVIDSKQENIYISSDNSIVKLKNFLDMGNNMFIHGPSKYSFKLVSLLRGTLKMNKDTEVMYDKSLNDWVIYPWKLNILHIFSYYDDTIRIKSCLEDNCRFFNARVGGSSQEYTINPISITFERKNKGALELLTRAVGDMADQDRYIFLRIEKDLSSINHLAPKSLPYLYKQAFLTAADPKLPKFGVLSQRLKSVAKISSSPEIHPDDFIYKSNRSELFNKKEEAIIFKCSGFRLVSSPGSNGSIEFLKSLTACENPDVFRSPLIHAFLMYKWDRVKWFIFAQTILHLSIMLLLCIDAATLREDTTVMILILIANVLIFLWELFQLSTGPMSYFTEIWNLLDITRIILIFIYIISSWYLDDKTWLTFLLALTLFLSMVRTASFFRLFRRTRYLIRMIQEIVWDMWPFLIVYFYSIFSFAWLFLVLSDPSAKDGPDSYSSSWLKVYMFNFGQYDTGDYKVLQWISLIITTTVNPLLMMNLLIAVMGDTYDRVQQDIVVADLKEIASQLYDIESVMFWRRKKGRPRYFQICAYSEGMSDSISMDDVWEGKVRQVTKAIAELGQLIQENTKPVNEELIIKHILSIKEDVQTQIKSLLDRQKAFEARVDRFLRNELSNSGLLPPQSLHRTLSLETQSIKTYNL